MAIPRVKVMSVQLAFAAKTEVGGHRSVIGSHWEGNLCIVLERLSLLVYFKNNFNIGIKLEVKNKKVLKFSRGVMHATLIHSVTENTLLPPQI